MSIDMVIENSELKSAEADGEGQTSTTGENPASPSRETPRYPLRSIRSKDGTGLADNENGGDIVEDEVGS